MHVTPYIHWNLLTVAGWQHIINSFIELLQDCTSPSRKCQGDALTARSIQIALICFRLYGGGSRFLSCKSMKRAHHLAYAFPVQTHDWKADGADQRCPYLILLLQHFKLHLFKSFLYPWPMNTTVHSHRLFKVTNFCSLPKKSSQDPHPLNSYGYAEVIMPRHLRYLTTHAINTGWKLRNNLRRTTYLYRKSILLPYHKLASLASTPGEISRPVTAYITCFST